MAGLLCVDLSRLKDANGRVPRDKIPGLKAVVPRPAPPAKVTCVAGGSSKRSRCVRRRGPGVAFDLEVEYDSARVHTTSTLAFKKRKAGIRKPISHSLRIIDYGANAAPARRGVTAGGKRPRTLTAKEREALERATSDSFFVSVDTGARGATIPMGADDFKRLLGEGDCTLLTDMHVNAYCELLNKRNAQYFASASASGCGERREAEVRNVGPNAQALLQGGRQRMFIFSSYLYTMLEGPQYKYSKVQQWTARHYVRVLEYGRLLLPVNVHKSHWVLAAVDVAFKRFVYLDSLRWGLLVAGSVLQNVRDWFEDEVRDKYGEEEVTRLDIASWETVVNPSYVPLQTDSVSCGVFALSVADSLELGRAPDFTQADVSVLRQHAALALMRGVLPR